MNTTYIMPNTIFVLLLFDMFSSNKLSIFEMIIVCTLTAILHEMCTTNSLIKKKLFFQVKL